MVREVEYGKSKKAFRRSVQGINLPASFGRPRTAGDLPGSSIESSNGGALGSVVSARRAAGPSVSRGESASQGNREASRKDWSDGGADRFVKKNSKDFSGQEKRRWVSDHSAQFGTVSKACKAIGLSPSSFYYKLKIDPNERLKRDSDLRDLIEEIQSKFPQYGVRGVQRELKWGYGKQVNRKRIHRVMREHGLRAQIYRGFKVSTTDSNHQSRIYPNLVHGMEVSRPNQLWVADITYVRIATCFVYVAAILDVFSRRVIGWAISKRIDTELCLAALEMAVENRKPDAGLIHHSDRGVQYASDAYVELLSKHGIHISMSRKGCCWDNAHMESFFGTLKREEVHLRDYETFGDVIMSLPKFMEDLYNEKRRHSSLGGLTPVEFEDKWKTGELQKLGIPFVIKLWDGSSK
jgi:putative transposase